MSLHGLHTQSEHYGEEIRLLPLQGIVPQSFRGPGHNLVTMLTMPSEFLT